MHKLMLSMVLLSVSASAANTTFKAFDFEHCRRWSISDEVQDVETGERLRLQHGGRDWSTFETWSFATSSSVLGVCRFLVDREIQCLTIKEQEQFPLSGASYKNLAFKPIRPRPMPSYQCVNGCESVTLKVLYEMPYEGGETGSDENLAYERELARFKQLCPMAK